MEERQLSWWTIRAYLITARNFLRFLETREIPIKRVGPDDVSAFLVAKLKAYTRKHGRSPNNEIQWRCDLTPPVHRLLALAQGRWPPPSEVDHRLKWFREKLTGDGLEPATVGKYAKRLRPFLEFLEEKSKSPELVTPLEVEEHLQQRLQQRRGKAAWPAAKQKSWMRRHAIPINRYLRFVIGQWPPPRTLEPELAAYQQHLIERGVMRETTLDYCVHVRIFLLFLRGRGVRVEDVRPEHVKAFHRVALRMFRNRRPNRANRVGHWRVLCRRSVRSYLRFRRGDWPPDPTRPFCERFAEHLSQQRYSEQVIGHYVWILRAFLRYLESEGVAIKNVTPGHVAAFLEFQRARYRKRNGHVPADMRSWRTRFHAPVTLFLRLLDPAWPRMPQPASGPERFQQEIGTGYTQWLIDVQGLSNQTLKKNGWIAREFLRWLCEQAGVQARRGLRKLDIQAVDRYLAWRLPPLRRATRVGVCSGLRSLFRHLHAAKLVTRDLAGLIAHPSRYAGEEIPRAFTQDQVDQILAAARSDKTATGLRDYAILQLLATYGLRAGEVIRLKLDDLDWRGERIRIRQSKTHAESFLPLVGPVGEAILAYLQRGRPSATCREVFLRSRAPRGPLSGAASLACIVRGRLQEAGITVKGRHGSHAFRFARALSLLRASVSLKWIGDLLGHTTPLSTQTYVRLATEDLRSLSLEVPQRKK